MPSPSSADQRTFFSAENSLGSGALETATPLALGPRNCVQSSASSREENASSRPNATNTEIFPRPPRNLPARTIVGALVRFTFPIRLHDSRNLTRKQSFIRAVGRGGESRNDQKSACVFEPK